MHRCCGREALFRRGLEILNNVGLWLKKIQISIYIKNLIVITKYVIHSIASKSAEEKNTE